MSKKFCFSQCYHGETCGPPFPRKEFQVKAEKKFRLDEQKIWDTTEKATKISPKILSNFFCIENNFLAFLVSICHSFSQFWQF